MTIHIEIGADQEARFLVPYLDGKPMEDVLEIKIGDEQSMPGMEGIGVAKILLRDENGCPQIERRTQDGEPGHKTEWIRADCKIYILRTAAESIGGPAEQERFIEHLRNHFDMPELELEPMPGDNGEQTP